MYLTSYNLLLKVIMGSDFANLYLSENAKHLKTSSLFLYSDVWSGYGFGLIFLYGFCRVTDCIFNLLWAVIGLNWFLHRWILSLKLPEILNVTAPNLTITSKLKILNKQEENEEENHGLKICGTGMN